MNNHTEYWKKIVSSENSKKEVYEHLKHFLTQSEECIDYLDKLMEKFVGVQLHENNLEISFLGQNGSNQKLLCTPPFTDKIPENYPKSFKKTIQVHNSMYLQAGGGGWFAYYGLFKTEDGGFSFDNGGFEYYCIEEGDNDEFLSQLNENGIEVSEIVSPFEFGQNWLVWNPLKNNNLGEPELCFVSHDDCEVVPISNATELSFGAAYLRILFMSIVNRESEALEEVYS